MTRQTTSKKPKLSKKRQESSRIITGYRKLLLTFALEAKGAVSLDSQFLTTLFLPRLQHLLYPIHTPGFPDPEAPDKQEVDRQPVICVESESDTLNRHTKALDPRIPLPFAHFRFKGNKRSQQASFGVQGLAGTRTGKCFKDTKQDSHSQRC